MTQLEFPSAPVSPATADLLSLVDADHLHAADRDRIDAAIEAVARADDGLVDPGRVRRLRCNDRGYLEVSPRVLSARYFALRRAGVLEPAGWVVSDDKVGRNAGKPARTWRWTGVGV